MKYYIYISGTKTDMLYPQIPKPLLKNLNFVRISGRMLPKGLSNEQ